MNIKHFRHYFKDWCPFNSPYIRFGAITNSGIVTSPPRKIVVIIPLRCETPEV